MKLKHIRIIKKSIVLLVLTVLLIFFKLIVTNTFIAEYIFARNLSRAVINFFGGISNLFSFSIFELLIIIAIIYVVVWLIKLIKQAKKRHFLLAVSYTVNLLIIVVIFANIYTITVGGSYYRQTAKLDYYDGQQLSYEQTMGIVDYFLDDYNQISDSLNYDNNQSNCPYSYNEISKLLQLEYDKLTKSSDNFYNQTNARAKKSMFSFLMTMQGTTGIAFLPTGEAHINYQTPQCYQIVTMAHEMAHVKGIMRESEANMVAYYILLSSDIPYFRYCGYMYSLSHITSLIYYYNVEDYQQVMARLPNNAVLERQKETDFWADKSGAIDKISTFFNDLYLKFSGVSSGVDSYFDRSEVGNDLEQTEPVINYSHTARVLIKIAYNNMEH